MSHFHYCPIPEICLIRQPPSRSSICRAQPARGAAGTAASHLLPSAWLPSTWSCGSGYQVGRARAVARDILACPRRRATQTMPARSLQLSLHPWLAHSEVPTAPPSSSCPRAPTPTLHSLELRMYNCPSQPNANILSDTKLLCKYILALPYQLRALLPDN